MKNILLTLFGLALGVSAHAQLVNNGGSIIVENGAVLFVESDIQNTLSGTITNSGKIEVQGDFDNSAGTLTSTSGAILEFSGGTAADFTPGTHTVTNVVMSKTSADVTLLGDLEIEENLSFEAPSKLNTADNALTLDEGATVSTPATDRYIIADAGVGGSVVQKKNNTDDVFFAIGDATYYTPVEATSIAGTTGASSTITASTEGMKAPNAPVEATDFINRYWEVEAAGITGFESTLVGTYNDADIDAMATEASISGAGYDGMSWGYAGSIGDAAANQVTVDVDYNAVELTGTNKFGKVDLKVFLQSPYSAGSGEMATALNSLLPLTSPYTVDAVSVGTIPNADIVDWILIELRDAADATSVLSSHSAFLSKDGSIVGLDGTSLPLLKDAPSTAFVSIKHRNHLPFRTNTVLDLSSTSLVDFTSNTNVYTDGGLSNAALFDLGGGTYSMHHANVNSDNAVNVVDFVFTRVNTNPAQTMVYSLYDINMDGNVNVVDFVRARLATNPAKTAHL